MSYLNGTWIELRTAHGSDGKFTGSGGSHGETHGAVSLKFHHGGGPDPTREYVPSHKQMHVVEVHKDGVKIGEAIRKGRGDYKVRHDGKTSSHASHEEAVSAIVKVHGLKPVAAATDQHGNWIGTHWR